MVIYILGRKAHACLRDPFQTTIELNDELIINKMVFFFWFFVFVFVGIYQTAVQRGIDLNVVGW